MVTRESALEEELFLGLRQLDGIDVGGSSGSTELRWGAIWSAGIGGVVEREGGVVRLAAGRLSVSNEVFVELMR